MFDKYLITGATGFLGRAVAAELVRHDAQVRALVLHNDPYISLLPKEVRTVPAMCVIKLSCGLLCGRRQPYLCDPLRGHYLRRVQTRPEALSGQCGRHMEDPPAMHGARCGKIHLCQLRPCHTGKTGGLRYHGKR